MDCGAVTKKYYAKWLGTEPGRLDKPGVFFIYNADRNEQPLGYPSPLDVYVYITPRTVIFSYGDRAAEKIPEVKSRLNLGMTAETIRAVLSKIYSSEVNRNIKFIYTGGGAAEEHPVKKLTAEDFDLYIKFFKEANPGCRDMSWVKDYFCETAAKGFCRGVIADGKLASVTDAPDMPFMSDEAQEIGINTLPGYRGKGYAKSVCLSLIREMIQAGICPLWSAGFENTASQKLSAAVGFTKFFDCLNLTVKG